MINRQVFLEYTRKMSLTKHCIHRAHVSLIHKKAVKDSYNAAFENMDAKIRNKELSIAKAVPFSKNLKEKKFTAKDKEYQRLLEGLLVSELKNEALNNTAAEVIAAKSKGISTVHFYYGVYEIPQKRIYEQGSSSSVTENESGELYPHVICVLMNKDGKPVHGFLYPAYREGRYGDKERYDYI